MNKLLLLLSLFLSVTSLADVSRPIRIAIIDTGLDITDPRFKDHICPEIGEDFTGEGLVDIHSHGTHVAGLITQYASGVNYCLIILKYYSFKDPAFINVNQYLQALDSLHKYKPDVVNYSGAGPLEEKSERAIIANLPNVKFFVSAGNEGEDLDKHCDVFPACYADKLKNISVIGNLNGTSNYGKVVSVWIDGNNIESTVPYSISANGLAKMTGSSMSTAIATGKWVHEHY